MSRKRFTRWLMVSGLFLAGCLDPYTPPKTEIASSFLVVDGWIDVTDGQAMVKLTRSLGLAELNDYPAVTGAVVKLKDDEGVFITLKEQLAGNYTVSHPFDISRSYQLTISIAGKNYESDEVAMVRNTPISNISWSADDTRFQVITSTSDPGEGARYYRYAMEETHEYRSFFGSSYKFVGNQPVFRFDEADNITRCWRTDPVSTIVLTTTEGLAENRIEDFPVIQLEKGDRKLWNDYSLLVRQIALDKPAYEYWSQLAKVSQSLGGLFDPIPFSLKGNVRNVFDPDEKVLGYFSGGEVSTARVRVKSDVLPDGYVKLDDAPCQEQYVDVAEVSSIAGLPFNLTRANYLFITIIGYFYATPECTDCRLQGGKNLPPPFMN